LTIPQSGIDSADLMKDLPRRKQAVWEADERIREQVRLELLGQHYGRAQPGTMRS
jgi:hypothetical protein